jgi:hypothetical protein
MMLALNTTHLVLLEELPEWLSELDDMQHMKQDL